MKKMIMLLGLFVAVMSVSALGAGYIGTPTAELEKNQWNAGFNYSYTDMDMEKTKAKWYEYVDGVLDDSGTEKMKIKEVKTQRYYGTIGYGVADWCEVFVQLGLADVKAKTKWEGDDEWEGGNFDNDFAWGLGTRMTFYEQDNIRWGTSIQMNWLDTSVDRKYSEPGYSEKGTTNLETYDLLVAVGPTVDMGGWQLYGGPFYYYLSGDLDYKESNTDGESEKMCADLEAESNFGGFVGGKFPLTENCNMTAEFSFTGGSIALGTGVVWKF